MFSQVLFAIVIGLVVSEPSYDTLNDIHKPHGPHAIHGHFQPAGTHLTHGLSHKTSHGPSYLAHKPIHHQPSYLPHKPVHHKPAFAAHKPIYGLHSSDKHNSHHRHDNQYSHHGDGGYEFNYGIADEYSGVNYGHTESRHGYEVKGVYYVHLPDSRIQKVEYYVDEYGYHPTVTYEGEAQFPQYKPHIPHHSSPGYY